MRGSPLAGSFDGIIDIRDRSFVQYRYTVLKLFELPIWNRHASLQR